MPLQLAASGRRWRVDARVPYARADGTVSRDSGSLGGESAVPGPGGPGGGAGIGQRTEPVVQSGLGDTVLGAAWTVLARDSGLELDLGVRAKLVTADRDDDLLTTGNPDYTFQAGLFAPAGRARFAGTLGWTRKGDLRVRDDSGAWTELDAEDPLSATVGLAFPAGAPVQWGADVYWREPLLADADAALELTAFLVRRGPRARMSVYVLAGFTDASPEFGAGIAFSGSR